MNERLQVPSGEESAKSRPRSAGGAGGATFGAILMRWLSTSSITLERLSLSMSSGAATGALLLRTARAKSPRDTGPSEGASLDCASEEIGQQNAKITQI